MFDGADCVESIGVEVGESGGEGFEWREIDRQLRRIARKRGELDAEELRWLARAERAELHRLLGMASMMEYVERVLGYGPKTGKERLRVARRLCELPRMAKALDDGVLPYSAVKELSRFVTKKTEAEWLEVTRGKTLREVEEMSSGRQEGDRPGDPVDPDLRERPITLDITPPTLGLFRDARRFLEDELGHAITDDEMIAIMCATVLSSAPRGAGRDPGSAPRGAGRDPGLAPRGADDGTARDGDGARDDEAAPRVPPYQVALTVCEYCERAWHDATGKSIAVPASTLEQARCDGQHIGNVTCEAPARAYQEIPPATARFVLRRDRGRCQVPGCRSSRWIHIHHIVPREHGGTNDPSNLICLCSAHHQSLHRKQISITGLAPDELVFDLRRYAEVTEPLGGAQAS
jgi:5-methylcytosine-specific restriction endonuclease McrA